MKGILACDIDGTITDSPFDLLPKVKKTLQAVYNKGWSIIFITGRPYVWGIRPLMHLTFPFTLAAINGANLIEMPQKQLIEEQLITKESLAALDDLAQKLATDYVVYSGFSDNDHVYYRPKRLPHSQREFLVSRAASVGEVWHAIEDYSLLQLKGFASIKFFGTASLCHEAAKYMEDSLNLHVPVIRDPLSEVNFVAQATAETCTKGQALKRWMAIKNLSGPIVAAGDDYNDISLLNEADVKIIMETAPKKMHNLADIIAPSASQGGLATILQELILK